MEQAVTNVLDKVRTGDIMQEGLTQVGTDGMGDAILLELEAATRLLATREACAYVRTPKPERLGRRFDARVARDDRPAGAEGLHRLAELLRISAAVVVVEVV